MGDILKKAHELWQSYSFSEKYEITKKYAERNNYCYPETCTEETINTLFPTGWDLFSQGVDLKDFANCKYISPDVGQGYGTFTQDECEKWCDEMFEEQIKNEDPEDIFGYDWDLEETDDEDLCD